MSNSCSESERGRGDGPLKRSLALLAAFALLWLACGSTPETVVSDATPNATPPFFEIRGGQGATLQLFGTIHLGPPEGWSFSPQIDRALARATTLVMEIDLRKTSEAAVSDAILRHAMLPDETSLSKIISGKTARLLQARDAELLALGLPSGLRERLKPWYIALSLVESTTQQTRYASSQSADQVVFSRLGARPLIALETVDQQLGMFDGLSLDLQELILQDTLARYETAAESLEELADAWRANDQDALIRLGRESLETLPQLAPFFDVLLDQRNQNWLPILTGLLEAPERAGTTVFVAVGSLHLVGPGSLPDLLRQRGYRAEQPTQALARDGAAHGKAAP